MIKRGYLLGIFLMLACSNIYGQSQEIEDPQALTKNHLLIVFGKDTFIDFQTFGLTISGNCNTRFRVMDIERAKTVSDSLFNLLQPILDIDSSFVTKIEINESLSYVEDNFGYILVKYTIESFMGIPIEDTPPMFTYKYYKNGHFKFNFSLVPDVSLPEKPYISEEYLEEIAQSRIRKYNEELYDKYINVEQPDSASYEFYKANGVRKKPHPEDNVIVSHDPFKMKIISHIDTINLFDYMFSLLIRSPMQNELPSHYKLIYRIQFYDGYRIELDPQTGDILYDYYYGVWNHW